MNYNNIITIWMCSCMLLALCDVNSLCPNGVCPGLGNGFPLWRINLAGNILTTSEGFTIFKDTSLGSCATYNPEEGDNTRSFVVSTSMQQYTTNVMEQGSLTVSAITAGLTASDTTQVTTSQSSTLTTSFSAVQMDIKMTNSTITFNLNSECLAESNFDPNFFADFQSLPAINDPTNSAQWTPYVDFMSKWGSHIMIEQDIGSRFQQFLSSTSSDSTTTNTLQIKNCAEVEGVDPDGGWSVSACAAYTQQQKQESLNTQSTDYRIITGGTETTRAQLTENITEASLDAFIASADNGDQPIAFSWEAIWDIIYFIYNDECSQNPGSSSACENVQRATNLEAAYEAWLALGCQSEYDGDGQVYQQMTTESDSRGIHTYQCSVSKTGCRTDNDCHVGGAGEVCYCYGPGCIQQGSQIPNSSEYRDQVQGSESGSYNQGVNNSCSFSWFECYCDASWSGGLPNRQIYTQGSP